MVILSIVLFLDSLITNNPNSSSLLSIMLFISTEENDLPCLSSLEVMLESSLSRFSMGIFILLDVMMILSKQGGRR